MKLLSKVSLYQTKVAGTTLHMESTFLLSLSKSKQLMDQAQGV